MPHTTSPLPLVISIQSQVAFGHVGNSAAAYPMRACGVEVIEVPTALLSNHPHYPTMHGLILEPDMVAGLLTGIRERGASERAAVILSGFLGKAGTARAVIDFVSRAKAANPRLTYVCDPVMGDADLGFFVEEPLRDVFREVVSLADVIMPNTFELTALCGVPIERAEDVARARAVLGRPAVVATSVPVPERPDLLATVSSTQAACTSIEVTHLPVRPAGTGDLLAGLTAARLAAGQPLETAVKSAVSGVTAALLRTSGEPWAEMPIAAAINDILAAGEAELEQVGS